MRPRHHALTRAVTPHGRASANVPFAAARHGLRAISSATYVNNDSFTKPKSSSLLPSLRSWTVPNLEHRSFSILLAEHKPLKRPRPSIGLLKRQEHTESPLPSNGPSVRTELTVLDPSLAPDGVSAVIGKSDDGETKLLLLVPVPELFQDPNSAPQVPGAQHASGTYCIDVNTVKNNSRPKIVAQRSKVAMQTPLNDTSVIALQPVWKSWIELVNRLDHNTPVPSSNWIQVKIHGEEWDLLELYHHVLTQYPYRAIATYPALKLGKGEMQVTSDGKCMEEIHNYFAAMQRQPKIKTEKTLETETDIQNPDGRSSWCETVDLPDSPHIPGYFRPPGRWSKAALNKYVMKIIRCRSPKMDRQGQQERDMVEHVLNFILFDSTPLRPFVSWVALHHALRFLIKQRKTPAARRFLTDMDEIGIAPNVEFFNAHLMGCAKEYNYDAFGVFLNLMDLRGIPPNNGTWGALLLCAPTPPTSQELASLMYKRRILKHSVSAHNHAAQIIGYSFGQYLDGGGSVNAYVNILGHLLRPQWPNNESITMLLDSLGQRLQMLPAVELAIRLFEGSKLDSAKALKGSVHILLLHCARQKNADLAVWLVVYANQAWNMKAEDHIIFALLFRAAWNSRMYNLCRVVWAYAMASGQVGHWIRSRIYVSLGSSQSPDQQTTVRARWRTSAALVICQQAPPTDAELEPTAVFDSERKFFDVHKPTKPFVVMIAEALALDRAWAFNGIKKSTSTQWKTENAITVPVS